MQAKHIKKQICKYEGQKLKKFIKQQKSKFTIYHCP